MSLPPIIKQAADKLQGTPDSFLTAGLFLVAIVAVLVALFAHPLVKAGVLAWMVMP